MKNLIYLLLLVISLPSFAARQFDIEVIIFKRNVNPDQTGESWPDQPATLDYARTVQLVSSSQLANRGITMMPASRYALNSQYQRLKDHAGFTPLAHFGWRQGDLNKAQAPTFRLTAGRNFSGQYLPDGTSIEEAARRERDGQPMTTPPSFELAAETQETIPAQPDQPLYELEGKIQVYVNHYLFTNTQLDLREPGRREVVVGTELPEGGTTALSETVQFGQLQEVKKKIEVEEFLKTFRFDQQRKMRSGETHYLDHPLMGMVVQIRRLDS
ncbi:peptidoglycan binding protein CsiV [Photobacterium sp. 1_MG-2023]|uniref:peptidoglycan binding protein CsiV n=1 Tax=Photobacterium sp. 1_MG-2023 TaxID=3062646 RepID=UPI0026E2B38D|nr:peptidoglycan binding protein CsiV [Photobacterium sp. 1_MG-2023]MDO6707335.1 peptidoglycan binding protein CsiV [Photobacterium sp. 1_MG-2023]